MLPVGFAWACVGLVSLSTNSPTVQAGGSLTVIGKEFAQKAPVLIHLDSISVIPWLHSAVRRPGIARRGFLRALGGCACAACAPSAASFSHQTYLPSGGLPAAT